MHEQRLYVLSVNRFLGKGGESNKPVSMACKQAPWLG